MASVFSGPKVQPTPAAPDPIKIPTADDPEVIAARKKKIADTMMTREGSASADLSKPYARTTLG